MKMYHLRNATMVLVLGSRRVLVDPMFCEPGAIPGLKMFGGGRRANPLVGLPPETDSYLEGVTDVLITHEHPDHLDTPAIRWIKARGLTVWASSVDVPNLKRKGLDARTVHDGALGMAVEVVPTQHGRGVLGWLMGPVSGFYLAHPNEPTVYITGDSVLTKEVLDAVERLAPDVVIAPAGSANFGIGPDILFSVDELVALAKRAPSAVVFNHLETLDHCPTSREGLRVRMEKEGLGDRVYIPKDGEHLDFGWDGSPPVSPVHVGAGRRPGFQKWLTAKFAGT